MSALPFLQSYNDPKKEKAYRRYMAGESQRKIAKALRIPLSTLALWSKRDEWEAERKARRISESAAGAAAEETAPKADAVGAAVGAPPPPAPTGESRIVRMERILDRQQRIVGRLIEAYERDVEKTLADADSAGKPISRSQIAQLTTLGNNLLTMERKAWGVPDKIETKDTTPAPADPIRTMTDDELERRDRELAEQLAAAEGRENPNRAGEAAPPSVN